MDTRPLGTRLLVLGAGQGTPDSRIAVHGRTHEGTTRVDTHDELPTETATSRRRLIASLLAGGTAAALAPVLAGTARAASGPDLPKRDAADNGALNAVVQREAALVATYASVVAATSGADDKAAMKVIHDHHLAYKQALAGFLGPDLGAVDSIPLAEPTGSVAAVAGVLSRLEDETVQVHLGTLARIKGTDAASLIASIITVEARHVAALALLSGAAPLAAAGL